MTGYMGGDQRIIINYRNQWANIMNPYKTLSVSYDQHFFRKKMNGSWFGGGLQVLSDQAGTSNLSNSKIALSSSFIYMLNDNNYLTSGIQLGFIQRSFSMDALYFDSQITPSGINTSLPNNENISSTSSSGIDVSFGLLWGYKPSDDIDIYTGISFAHLNQPKLGFNETDYTLKQRSVFHSGMTYNMTQSIFIQPSFIYQYQSKANELIMGASIGHILKSKKPEKAILAYYGFWYRNSDALIPFCGVEIERLKLGLSYDINSSSLRTASNYKGGFEISIKWEMPKPSKRMVTAIPCPRF
jgi:type IX secretion system PorP/SprF family membrane protein